MNSRVFASGLIIVLALFSVFAVSHAASPTGVENITLSSHSAVLSPGSNAIVNYNLSLISGYYQYGTELYIVDYNKLGAENITILITNKSGNPPIKGTMYIFLSHVLNPGTYNITLAGNSSGTTVKSDTLVLIVSSPNSTTTKSTSSTPSSTSTVSISTSSTAPPSSIQTAQPTISGSEPQNNYAYYALVAIIAIVIVIVVIVALRGGSGIGRRPDQQSSQKQTTT